MKKAKYKYIYCDVFKRGISIFIGTCSLMLGWAKDFYKEPYNKSLIEHLEKYCTDNEYKTKEVGGRTYISDCGECVVHLPAFSFKYNPIEISTLSHELLHAVHYLLDFLGIEYVVEGSNETFTYLHEYLLKNALLKEGYKEIEYYVRME